MRTLAAVFACAVSAVAVTASQEAPLIFGLLRHDGILTPLAAYENGGWVPVWRQTTDTLPRLNQFETELPFWRERRLKLPERWALPLAPPNRGTDAAVLGRVIHEEYCGYQIGLLTDAPRASAEPFERHLAASRAITATMPRALSAGTDAALWRALAPRIESAVREQERRAIAEWERHANRSAQLPAEEARGPIRIERILADTRDGSGAIYYEAVREYRKPARNVPLPSMLVANGWIHTSSAADGGALAAVSQLTDREFSASGRVRPVGTVTLDGATFWVGRSIGYEGEALTIVQTAPVLREAIRIYIGGC